jgi:hypothetical protein
MSRFAPHMNNSLFFGRSPKNKAKLMYRCKLLYFEERSDSKYNNLQRYINFELNIKLCIIHIPFNLQKLKY